MTTLSTITSPSETLLLVEGYKYLGCLPGCKVTFEYCKGRIKTQMSELADKSLIEDFTKYATGKNRLNEVRRKSVPLELAKKIETFALSVKKCDYIRERMNNVPAPGSDDEAGINKWMGPSTPYGQALARRDEAEKEAATAIAQYLASPS